MNDDLKRLEELFQAAADLPAAEWAPFLNRECGREDELKQRLLAMLARMDQGDSLGGPGSLSGPGEGPGTVIDRYKLLERIGEGGFGSVYMAEQLEPMVRKVALKVIRLGMDTKEVVARFEAERQALALMDHPNIARVLDGGTTSAGRPYFVMELVQGVSITEYCDRNQVPTAERLELFQQVCRAVQHAHQKGVIHRDLKPSNIMVTHDDGRPIPKVIDFGIAKAMHFRLTEKTLFTRYGAFVGTPAYMSPEQAELSAREVDARSDIYSLGALLYELLVGTPPFEPERLREAGFAEIQRIIREQVPERPSLRISKSGDGSIAERRQVDVRDLSRSLRGDLDWIVLKALEKDRDRRYESAGAFGDDIQRHLRRQPVLAGRPSRLRRLARGGRRIRFGLVGLVALIVLVVVTLLAVRQAEVSRMLALEARMIAEEQAQLAQLEQRRVFGLAQQADERSDEVTRFLTQILQSSDPVGLGADQITVRNLLDQTAQRIETNFEQEPRVRAGLRVRLGAAYAKLEDHVQAEAQYRAALEILEPDTPADATDRIKAESGLGRALLAQDQPEQAEPLLLRCHQLLLEQQGAEDEQVQALGADLARLYRAWGKPEQAERFARNE